MSENLKPAPNLIFCNVRLPLRRFPCSLCSNLSLSPSMAAVTLLALGNGAPDVFSSLSALRSGHPRTGLGAILSAGTPAPDSAPSSPLAPPHRTWRSQEVRFAGWETDLGIRRFLINDSVAVHTVAENGGLTPSRSIIPTHGV